MGWSIQTHDLNSIRSFKEATEHWEKQEPWKSEHQDRRSLAGRRKTHMFLRKLSQGGFECVLYSSAIATYYPDGSVKLSVYDTQSTIQFAWHMSPLHCTPLTDKGQMHWQVQTPDGPHIQRDTMVIVPADDPPFWIVTNPGAQAKEWVLDRSKAAEVRKLLTPYQKWYEMTARLMNHHSTKALSTYGYERSIEQLLREPTNAAAYPEYMETLSHPRFFWNKAYEIYGAKTKQLVPYDRLPKERA